MNLRKGAAGVVASVVLVSGIVAGIAFADENYQPTLLGNSSYSNHVDLKNDIYVDGINYVGAMSGQNSDYLDETASLSNQIGSQAGDAYALRVINKLSANITTLEVMGDDQTSYTKLELGSSIAAGEEACWWYAQEYREYKITNQSGKEYTTPANTTFRATLDNGSTVIFHNVNMNGVLSLAFCYSDDYGVNFVERTTLTNHTPDPTVYYEYNLLRGYSDDTDTTYTAKEFNYHVNSAVRMGDRMFTESRGSGWEVGLPENWESVDYSPDFGVYVPLYGEPSGEYTDGTYAYLYWNPQLILWRQTNGDAGTWGQAGEVSGAGEYGTEEEELVDYHPGMDEGDWTYTSGE